MSRKRKILITGAAGFVGEAIAEELKKNPENILFKHCGRNKIESVCEKVLFGDIRTYNSIKNWESIGEIDIVIHSAGLAHQFGTVQKADFWSSNVEGTANVCRASKKLNAKCLILISSVSVYGKHVDCPIDESFECKPEGFYAESKLEAELIASEFCRKNEIKLVILRLATVIGENDRGNTWRLIQAIDKGRFIWIGNGKNKKSLIYKGEVARAVREIIENKPVETIEIFNLSSEPLSMKEIVENIYQNLGKSDPGFKLNKKIFDTVFRLNDLTFSIKFLKKLSGTLDKWLSNDIFSSEKFHLFYDYKPTITVSEGIARQVLSYLKVEDFR